MPAVLCLAAEVPNLVGSIFTERKTEDMEMKTERFEYLESDV